MDNYSNIILSICISIFIYLVLDLMDNIKESFDPYNFKCMPQDNYIYTTNIKKIKNNLVNDGYLSSDTFESDKLLNIYNILLCDLKNINIDNAYDMKIISHLEIPLDTNNIVHLIDKIFYKINNTTDTLINKISKVSNEETNNKYSIYNTQLLENIKQERLMKILS